MSLHRPSAAWLAAIAVLAGMVATTAPGASALAASAPAFSAEVTGSAVGDDAVFGQDGIALGQGVPAPLFIAAQ